MARNLGGRPLAVLRQLLSRPPPSPAPREVALLRRTPQPEQLRMLCSSSSSSGSGLPSVTLVKSDQDMETLLNKARADRLPSVFYFTASWCGPCKLMSPLIEDLSKKYQNVKIYKIDVDQKELESTLTNLNIRSVPTLHFFQNGEKASEMVGADAQSLKKTMESLYK